MICRYSAAIVSLSSLRLFEDGHAHGMHGRAKSFLLQFIYIGNVHIMPRALISRSLGLTAALACASSLDACSSYNMICLWYSLDWGCVVMIRWLRHKMTKYISNRMPDRMPEKTSGRTSDTMSEYMSSRLPAKKYDRMSEYMSDRLSGYIRVFQ